MFDCFLGEGQGGIDYVMQALYKNGMMEHKAEKRWNAAINSTPLPNLARCATSMCAFGLSTVSVAAWIRTPFGTRVLSDYVTG